VEEVDDGPIPKPPIEHINDVDDEQSEKSDEYEVSTDDCNPKNGSTYWMSSG
jgi:hypothetical protein